MQGSHGFTIKFFAARTRTKKNSNAWTRRRRSADTFSWASTDWVNVPSKKTMLCNALKRIQTLSRIGSSCQLDLQIANRHAMRDVSVGHCLATVPFCTGMLLGRLVSSATTLFWERSLRLVELSSAPLPETVDSPTSQLNSMRQILLYMKTHYFDSCGLHAENS